MILYYLSSVVKDDELPEDLIDVNVRSDYRKLQYLIYTEGRLNGNFERLKSLIAGETISVNTIAQDFSAFNLAKEENFTALLFYLGLITLKPSGLSCEFTVPNETIKRIDVEYLSGALEERNIFNLSTYELSNKLADFARTGDTEVFEFLACEIKRNTGIRDYIYGEACIKSMYLAYLSLSQYYVVKSENELNKGFADIFLKPLNPYVEYVGLVEIKYFPRKNTKTGKGVQKPRKEQIEQTVKEAAEELKKYEKDELVTSFTDKGKKLQKVVLVFHGWELIHITKV